MVAPLRLAALAVLAAAAPPASKTAPPSGPKTEAVSPDAGGPAPPRVQGSALQEALLREALYLVRRDHCILVDETAPAVPSYDVDAKGRLAPMKAPLPQCSEEAPPLSLLRAAYASLALVEAGVGANAPGAAALLSDDAAAEKAFSALFSRPLVASRTAGKGGGEVVAFDPAALQAAFDALWIEPDDVRLGVPARRIYDAALKPVLARLARDVAALTAKPPRLAAEARRLEARTLAGQTVDNDALRASLNALVTSDEDAARIDPALVGFVLRRARDGSLPVLVAALRRTLERYDPQAAKLLLDGR